MTRPQPLFILLPRHSLNSIKLVFKLKKVVVFITASTWLDEKNGLSLHIKPTVTRDQNKLRTQ